MGKITLPPEIEKVKKEKTLRRLKKIDVNFISLVDKGANRKKLIFKRDAEGETAFEKILPIRKQDNEERIIFCIVYSPDEFDTQGDCASADVIKEASYGFMRSARTNNIDKQHDCIADEGFVAESWIVKENDFVFPEETEGSWAVGIKVENKETWNLIKGGEITGISLAGIAVTEEVGKRDDSRAIEIPVNKELEQYASLEHILDKVNELAERIEKREMGIEERLLNLERDFPFSRQLRKETEGSKETIKIWT